MSIDALDSVRRRHLFEPWLLKKEAKHQILSNSVVRSIVIDAVTNGSNKTKLKSTLDPFFNVAGESASKFIHSLRKKIKEWNRIDNYELQKNTNKKPIQEKHSHNDQRHQNKPPFSGAHIITYHNSPQPPTTSQTTNTIIPQIRVVEKTSQPVPSFFLSTEQISLRTKDQKIETIRLNEKGEQIDENGNVVNVDQIKPNETTKYHASDRTIPTVRKTKSYEFHFIDTSKQLEELEKKRDEIRTDLSVAAGLPIFDVIAMRRNYEIPEIDWWDEPFINKETWEPVFDTVDATFQNTAPVPVQRKKEKEIPTMLTPEERKREKHLKKLEKANEERLMIRLNLKEPEPPRVKTKTLINFNSGEAFLKPTEVEKRVRDAYEARQKAHVERNEKAKLTPEQKQQKEFDKRAADAIGNTVELVYSIKNIYHPLQFSKVLSMANKWNITGGIFHVKYPEMFFVVAECGEKGAKKFAALMENRVDWKMEYEGIDKVISQNNECKLVFQSAVLPHSQHFRNFRKYVFDVTTQCSRFFQKYKAGHLFDSATRVERE